MDGARIRFGRGGEGKLIGWDREWSLGHQRAPDRFIPLCVGRFSIAGRFNVLLKDHFFRRNSTAAQICQF